MDVALGIVIWMAIVIFILAGAAAIFLMFWAIYDTIKNREF
jgi:hypothetical protein